MSLVAVCCAKDAVSIWFFSCNAMDNRTFSIAITAWFAKVWSIAICLSVNGVTSVRRSTRVPIGVRSRSSGTLSCAR